MAHVDKIVVGVDGSKEALHAVDWAAAWADKCGGSLKIVCAYAIASYSASALDGGLAVLDDDALRNGAERVVWEAQQHVTKAFPDLRTCTGVEAGDATAVLSDMSKEADLIVLGSTGGGGFADRLLGSVSSSVPGHAECPVVVVPPHKSGEPFMPVRRIVVGVDGSEVASMALKKAVDAAAVWGAELTVVAAVPIAMGGGVMAWMPTAIDRQSMIDDIRASLDKAIEAAVGGREISVARHALDGNPAQLLTEFSTAVDLVIVGTRGRGGFAGMLLGSTSQTVLNHSTCPVMTVPSTHLKKTERPLHSWERR